MTGTIEWLDHVVIYSTLGCHGDDEELTSCKHAKSIPAPIKKLLTPLRFNGSIVHIERRPTWGSNPRP